MTLAIEHLSKQFVKNGEEPVESLVDISIEVNDEEFICILGPSGCGKTTLLRIIAGLDHPTSGSVRIDGLVIDRPNRKLGMIFQDYSLYPWRTVVENIAFGLELQDVPKEQRSATIGKYLEMTGLSEFGNSYPYELSGGMRQRVAVVRALAIDPTVLLMDEPFGALDAQTRNKLQHDLLDIWGKTRKTILFVTHSVDEAVFLADRIVVLTPRPGRICEIIPIDQPRPRNRTSAEFGQVRRHVLDLINQPKCVV
ncbi:MAG: ABC transporter ATP-binding protein [Methanoregula sp.]|jgi:NitT/TauT family transport system ATP-binding protein|nr:ABC transporter ATP-binding protein [Methanoregula sp.]